jgi:hypothetical protein
LTWTSFGKHIQSLPKPQLHNHGHEVSPAVRSRSAQTLTRPSFTAAEEQELAQRMQRKQMTMAISVRLSLPRRFLPSC